MRISLWKGIVIPIGITILRNRHIPNKRIIILMEKSFHSRGLFREPNEAPFVTCKTIIHVIL
jgi:hypothetical protein